MKHFLVEITYKIPAEELGQILAEHRTFLKTGYDAGLLLMSGPQNPRTGGIVIARAESLAEIETFFAQDPYRKANVAAHRIVEFDPVLFRESMQNWIKGD